MDVDTAGVLEDAIAVVDRGLALDFIHGPSIFHHALPLSMAELRIGDKAGCLDITPATKTVYGADH